MKTDYVVGFAFSRPREDGSFQRHSNLVLLVHKTKPDFLAGKWNGVGGKIEPGEAAHDAMAREFREETGIATAPFDWVHFAQSEMPRSRVWFFAAYDLPQICFEARPDANDSGELLQVFLPDALPPDAKENLRWLVPLAREAWQLAAPIHVQFLGE